MTDIPDFACPECGAIYKRVRVPKPEPKPYREAVHCLHCGEPFNAEDGTHFLKYLMVDKARLARR
jgi:formylmethanofuran dehydrogenase subunit E